MMFFWISEAPPPIESTSMPSPLESGLPRSRTARFPAPGEGPGHPAPPTRERLKIEALLKD
jgi:hypothetical protein